jgi:hypothetical protein
VRELWLVSGFLLPTQFSDPKVGISTADALGYAEMIARLCLRDGGKGSMPNGAFG